MDGFEAEGDDDAAGDNAEAGGAPKAQGPGGARPQGGQAGSSHRPTGKATAGAAGAALSKEESIASNLNKAITRISQPFLAG